MAKRTLDARVGGPLVFNNMYDILEAAKCGFGLAYLQEDLVAPLIDGVELIPLLEDWCHLWSGLHLYYPNRRHPSRAMTLLVDALRYAK